MAPHLGRQKGAKLTPVNYSVLYTLEEQGVVFDNTAQQVRVKTSYLNETRVLKDLVWVTDEFELLDDSHRFIQVEDNSGCRNAEIRLRRGETNTSKCKLHYQQIVSDTQR